MIIVVQSILRILQYRLAPFHYCRAKPFTLHCSLLLLVLLYAFFGGLVFNKLEGDALKRQQNDDALAKRSCILEVLDKTKKSVNETASELMQCWRVESDDRTEWTYVTSTLYGFGIVTTLGYNRIAPSTYAGRMFCILYGICGIPITMIIIANVGQYLNQFARNSRIKVEQYRDRRRRSKATGEVPESSTELMSLVLLVVFLLYVTLGALLLPLLNGKIDFFNGLYYNFLCLTAIDFGQLVPQRVAFLPITFIYVCVGLAITTIAIDVGSEYMKKLHYLGKKMKNVATTKIWFGGKTLKVKDLLHAVGKKCGVEASVIDGMDLDNVIERAIAINEGRTPPEDTNEEPPPPREPSPRSPTEKTTETCPLLTNNNNTTPPFSNRSSTKSKPAPLPNNHSDLILRNPMFGTRMSACTSPGLDLPFLDTVFDDGEMVAISVPEEFSDDEQAVTFAEPEVMATGYETVVETPFSMAEMCEVRIVESAPVTLIFDEVEEPKPLQPEEAQLQKAEEEPSEEEQETLSETPSTATRSSSPDTSKDKNWVPRRFREKKEKYGRDARKLFETYQEEWERLERLSDRRLGAPRRKSVLAQSQHNLSALADRSPSDTDGRLLRQPDEKPHRSSVDIERSNYGP